MKVMRVRWFRDRKEARGLGFRVGEGEFLFFFFICGWDILLHRAHQDIYFVLFGSELLMGSLHDDKRGMASQSSL